MLATKRFPLRPSQPHRLCWGCDRYCAADAMACGNGSVRTLHPAELFGEDWAEWCPLAVPDSAAGAPPEGHDALASAASRQ